MLERDYQARLVKKLYRVFPGCVVLKNDTGYIQGILDLTVLHRERWAMLEVKAHEKALLRPNQSFYVEKLNEMSFAAVICPENEEEILRALQQTFEPSR